MKGVVFTEFLEMVSSMFGEDMADDIIDDSNLPSGGAYTQVGTYDHTEIVALVSALSVRTETPVPTLLKVYGKHLFGRFSALYPVFFETPQTAFDFLSGIENYIHVEVRKLYPDAELPTFDIARDGNNKLTMIYRSGRHFEDLAEGLIEGCLEYYKEDCLIEREDETTEGAGSVFTITKK